MKISILGCGSSLGIPIIGCECRVCKSTNPRNNRTRTSIHIQTDGPGILIDTSPDLRMQLFKSGIKEIFNVLYTHEHADHTHGIDELRIMRIRSQIVNIYSTDKVLAHICNANRYTFNVAGSEQAYMRANAIDWYDTFEIDGVVIESYKQHHGEISSVGYKIGEVAYSTDVNAFPEKSLELLENSNIKVFLIECIGYTENSAHANLDLCLEWIRRVKPELAVLTHMGHQIDYDEISSKLPPNVIAAFDGLIINTDDLSYST